MPQKAVEVKVVQAEELKQNAVRPKERVKSDGTGEGGEISGRSVTAEIAKF